ncbi:jg6452 [Pararge aegeria aegeria]|uniref:Jg6452 protein n=1 Tax=Pararge aegeria aegeria TaxID=348720 RepID=A0A8S4RRY2_9NEOP|nr:jg6452 [Pararge aegeria aegeria]
MMPDGVKTPQSASPLARAGAGDSSAARGSLHATPPNANLVRIRSCLDQYRTTPVRPVKIGPKAVSMEDLTPTTRSKKDRKEPNLPTVRSPGLSSAAEEKAAARIGRFMLVAVWRRRRDDIRCLRKTLECQVTCSERLRIQVCALKSLLDSDNAKVRLAIREVERLKKLLRDKEMEKAVLEKEKYALEQDVCAAEDHASEMSVGWRNCRNELEGARVANASVQQALALERAASQEARALCDRTFDQSNIKWLLLSRARERCSRESSALNVRVSLSARETNALRAAVGELRAQLQRVECELEVTREQLDWWPRPLTKKPQSAAIMSILAAYRSSSSAAGVLPADLDVIRAARIDEARQTVPRTELRRRKREIVIEIERLWQQRWSSDV